MSEHDEEQSPPAPVNAVEALRPATVISTAKAVRDALRPLGRRRVVMAVLALGFAGIAAIGAMTVASMYWTSQPSFCAKCHPMKKYVTAWAQTKHKDVNCEECHTATGTLGFVGGKIAGLQVVVNYFRGKFDDTSFNAAVPNRSCESCHQDVMKKTIVRHGIKVEHKSMLEGGSKCGSCHSTVGHGDAVPVGNRNKPTMAACFKCHDDKTASTKCSECHVDKADLKKLPVAAKLPGAAPGAPIMPTTTVAPAAARP